MKLGLRLQVSRSEDNYPTIPTIIDNNSQTIRFNFSFSGSGRFRVEIERSELIGKSNQNFLPFELTRGNAIGKNYFWRLNFDYRLSANLQSTVNYDGRILSGSKTVHTARAELRAYF